MNKNVVLNIYVYINNKLNNILNILNNYLFLLLAYFHKVNIL